MNVACNAIGRVAAVLLCLAAWPTLGYADATACASYQTCLAAAESQRWAELAQAVQASAQELRRAREALRNTEREGDTASVSSLRAQQAQAQADWEAKQHLADLLTGEQYRNFLLDRGADLDAWAAQAHHVLQRTVERIRELNLAFQEQSQSDVRLLERAAREERSAADSALWNATLEFIRRRIEQARDARLDLSPADAAASPRTQPALVWERVEPAYEKLKAMDPAQGVQDGSLSAAVAQTGLLLWEQAGPSAQPAPLSADAGAVFSAGTLSGDLMDLALVHSYFEKREQPPALPSERQHQLEIDRVRRVAELARAERDRALDALVRQAGVEDQLKLIRARLSR